MTTQEQDRPTLKSRMFSQALPYLKVLRQLDTLEQTMTANIHIQCYGTSRRVYIGQLTGPNGFGKVLDKANREGMSIGIALNTLDTTGERHKHNVTAISAIWLDVDAKTVEAPLSLDEILALLPTGPTMVVATGSPNSYHLYWVLAVPISLSEYPEAQVEAERMMKVLCRLVPGGDPQPTGIQGVLRLPGFKNPKDGAGWAETVVLDGPIYDFDHLSSMIPTTLLGPDAVVNVTSMTGPKMSETRPFTVVTDEIEELVGRYLEFTATPAVEGENGSTACLTTAIQCGPGFGLDPEDCLEFMELYYNERCEPEWSREELVHKVKSAYAKADGWAWRVPPALDTILHNLEDAMGIALDIVEPEPTPAPEVKAKSKKPQAAITTDIQVDAEDDVMPQFIASPPGRPKAKKVSEDTPEDQDVSQAPPRPKAKKISDPAHPVLPACARYRYLWTEEGLHVVLPTHGDNVEVLFLSQLFRVEAQLVDGQDNDHSLRLSWLSMNGVKHEMTVNRKDLMGDANNALRALNHQGLVTTTLTAAKAYLVEFLARVESPIRGRTAREVGWCDGAYVTPTFTAGEVPGGLKVFLNSNGDHQFYSSGTLQEWKENIGVYAAGNSRLTLAMTLAFTGPLLHLIGADSFGIHLFTRSSQGKTTMSIAAGSIWGGPATPTGNARYVNTWRATANGLESTLATHKDGLLVLDEILQAQPKEINDVIYMINSGTGKTRMSKAIELRPRLAWTLAVLSNGERTPEEIVKAAKIKYTAGADVRMITVPMVEKGFEVYAPFADRGALTHHLQSASGKYYGTAIRAFLTHLTSQTVGVLDLRPHIEKGRDRWAQSELDRIQSGKSGTVDPQVQRVARNFGIIRMAGKIAITAQVLPITIQDLDSALRSSFDGWLSYRGGLTSREAHSGIRSVLNFIEKHARSRFQSCGFASEYDDKQIRDIAGYIKTITGKAKNDQGLEYTKAIATDYLLTSAGFEEACGHEAPRDVIDALKSVGILKCNSKRSQRQHRIPGTKSTTLVYYLSGQAINEYLGTIFNPDGNPDESTLELAALDAREEDSHQTIPDDFDSA